MYNIFTHEAHLYKVSDIHRLQSYTSRPDVAKNSSICESNKKATCLISEDSDNMLLEINLQEKDLSEKKFPAEEVVKVESESSSVVQYKPMKTGMELSMPQLFFRNV